MTDIFSISPFYEVKTTQLLEILFLKDNVSVFNLN